MSSNVVEGRVAGLSNTYADGIERQEIHVPLARASGLPIKLNARVTVDLQVGGKTYAAGLRSKGSNGLAWICPDLLLPNGLKVRLADAMRSAGFRSGDRVRLATTGRTIEVSRS